VEMAKLTAEETGAEVKFAVADAQCLPCNDETYDVVVLRNVVWNTYHPQRVLCEAARVLKKGGTLIMSDGNWQADIAAWESENEDRSTFPNYRKRDLGLGAFEIINEYYGKLPLNKVARPAWDMDAVAKASLKVEKCEQFTDPMLTDELKPTLKPGFLLIARK
ncbi:MAG: methyltransferase domain-containing protein, partial [archaeon]|nr:methyltransferase domain-containing protein [archaeon]